MTRVELPFDSDFHCPEGTPKSRGLSCANISVCSNCLSVEFFASSRNNAGISMFKEL